MGIFVLIFSLVAFFTVTVGPTTKMGGFRTPMETERFVIQKRTYQPPARRSVIVAPDGQAHRTADGTQMTKRDRARMILETPRTFEYKLPETAPDYIPPAREIEPEPIVAPNLDVVTQSETKALEDMSVPMMPALVTTDSSTEPPVALSAESLAVPTAEDPANTVDAATNQKILSAILQKEGNLSEWARVTLRCSFREGLVILYGVVKDEQEKKHIADLTKSLPDVVTVENQLHPVGAEADTAQDITQ